MLDVTPPGVLAVVVVEVVAAVVLCCIDVVTLLAETPEGVWGVPKLVERLGMVGNNEGCKTPGALAVVGCGICYV